MGFINLLTRKRKVETIEPLQDPNVSKNDKSLEPIPLNKLDE